MLQFGSMVSGSSIKSLAANTAATASIKEVVRTGKSCKVADTSCHHMSQRDLAYFSSERFAKVLKMAENQQLAAKYGKLIASRKRDNRQAYAQWLADVVIYCDLYEAHDDGYSWSYEEVRDLFKGYRSKALREAKKSTGFNAQCYYELAKALGSKEEVRYFLKAINRPILRDKLSL